VLKKEGEDKGLERRTNRRTRRKRKGRRLTSLDTESGERMYMKMSEAPIHSSTCCCHSGDALISL
jgi:hypothetical protein